MANRRGIRRGIANGTYDREDERISEVWEYMVENLDANTDRITGEVNCTMLAEDAQNEFEGRWPDIDDEVYSDMAVDVVEEEGRD